MKEIYFAGGCFWGTEHYLRQIAGVVDTEVGFANGNPEIKSPSYEQVYTDATGYAEAVRVAYDPSKVSLKFLVSMYFKAIDPTSLNRQGMDFGTRYRTGIYFKDAEDEHEIRAVYDDEQRKSTRLFEVELLPLANFYPASEYHQDYLQKHPDGYCHLPSSLFEFAKKAKPA